jgi:hypothetical protein
VFAQQPSTEPVERVDVPLLEFIRNRTPGIELPDIERLNAVCDFRSDALLEIVCCPFGERRRKDVLR